VPTNDSVFKKVKILVDLYKTGRLEGFEVPYAEGGVADSFLKIAIANTGTDRGEDGVCVYDLDDQETVYNLLDDHYGIVIVAGYGQEYHVFVAEYDKAIDLHAPIYFLGAIEE